MESGRLEQTDGWVKEGWHALDIPCMVRVDGFNGGDDVYASSGF